MKLFSFLLPTRKRAEWCIDSIKSIYFLARDKTCFEIVLAFDEDDDTRDLILKVCDDLHIDYKSIVVPRHGYIKLHYYYNNLAKIASGAYMWLWNDDAFFLTLGWDDIMKEDIQRKPDVVWDFTSSFAGILPCIPRRYIDTMQHFSLHAHNDTWIEAIFCHMLQLWEVEDRVRIRHIHTDANDPEYNNQALHDTKQSLKHTVQEKHTVSTLCLYVADALKVVRTHFKEIPHEVMFPQLTNGGKRVGVVGMGKLGLPVAVGMAAKGHVVHGYDVAPHITPYAHPRDCLFTQEADETGTGSMQAMLDETTLRFVDSIDTIVAVSEIVFVAVQTPHGSEYEGITRIPHTRQDFDYTYLVDAVTKITDSANRLKQNVTVVIISTVLPSTIRSLIMPILETSSYIRLCYNPYFIAMGTVLRDFYHPEFVLLGTNDDVAAQQMKEFYATISDAPVFHTTIENAELVKVCYNTMISTKIAFANTIMELCDNIPNTNVDDVTDALALATRRITSAAYLRGGMGDGGGCHPRDNIAMSWLSKKHSLSYNIFDSIMMAREHQTEYLADLVQKYYEANDRRMRVCILGIAFKPNTRLITGSPSILLKALLEERGVPCTTHDHHVLGCKDVLPSKDAMIFFIGTKHDAYTSCTFPSGSVIIDPHRYIQPDTEYAALHRVGDTKCSIHRIEVKK